MEGNGQTKRKKAHFRAVIMRQQSETTGRVAIRGKKEDTYRGLIFGTGGAQGGISCDPGVEFAYFVRKKLRPIRIPPTKVYDGNGALIAEIHIDPVTGERTRRSV